MLSIVVVKHLNAIGWVTWCVRPQAGRQVVVVTWTAVIVRVRFVRVAPGTSDAASLSVRWVIWACERVIAWWRQCILVSIQIILASPASVRRTVIRINLTSSQHRETTLNRLVRDKQRKGEDRISVRWCCLTLKIIYKFNVREDDQ